MPDWGTVLSSAVVASLMTSLLNNAFLWGREQRQQRREARGMLQRARTAAAMFLESVDEAEHDPAIKVTRRLERLREMMLSAEFTTATADVDLDDAFRALEKIESEIRYLAKNSEDLRQYEGDARSLPPVFSDGTENPNFDEEMYERRAQLEQWQRSYVERVKKLATRLLRCIKDRQLSIIDNFSKEWN